MKIPLQTKLKRETHRQIAYAQDLIVKEVYTIFNKAVLHGGTAIWRCYDGKRFSEDLDFYFPKDNENSQFGTYPRTKVRGFNSSELNTANFRNRKFRAKARGFTPQEISYKEKIELLFNNLKKIGFEIKKKKISENSVYSELSLERTYVRLEATFQKISGVICDYEMSDGNFISIYSLTSEMFLVEKINTYLKILKVRDLWDIFFLLKKVENMPKQIENLIKNYKKPVDEENLQIIILEGIVPSANEMFEYIKRKWENKYI